MPNLPFTRGRLSVNLSPVAFRAQGLQTLGAVESKGETRFLCVDSQGNYWACVEGQRPIALNPKRAQDAIGEAATGVKQFTQADRMEANRLRREAHALREAERLKS